MCSSSRPVTGSRDSEFSEIFDAGRDQHGLVTGKDGLAESYDAFGLVIAAHGPSPRNAVWLSGERL